MKSKYRKDITDAVFLVRQKLRLTLQEFVDLLEKEEGVKVTPSTLSKYERGIIPLSAERYFAILNLNKKTTGGDDGPSRPDRS